MHRSILLHARLAVVAALAVLALTAGASTAQASSSCGVYNAGGHMWIIVVRSVSCPKAKAVVRSLAAQTVALRSGQRKVVHTSLLPGFTCVLASRGKPGGSCAGAGAVKSVTWLGA